MFRLHLGPYRSQDEARPIADRIQAEFNLRPVLVSEVTAIIRGLFRR